MDKNSAAAQWFRDFSKTQVTRKPKAIVVFSAHWEESTIKVHTAENPTLLFDYYGFPSYTYKFTYPAPGNPALSHRVISLLREANIEVEEEKKRGWDHGVFIPLMLMFPDHDIPIVEVSLHSNLSPKTHIKLGEVLSPLRDEEIMFVGSGFATHNLNAIFSGDDGWLRSWDEWLTETITEPSISPLERKERLINWAKAPSARAAHPREEHLIPLHVIAGTASTNDGGIEAGTSICSLSYGATSFRMFAF